MTAGSTTCSDGDLLRQPRANPGLLLVRIGINSVDYLGHFMTIQEFISRERITIVSEYADSNPNMTDSVRQMNHYRCLLTRRPSAGRVRKMSVYFSMGLGLSGKPDAASVLDCLASDASGAEESFDDWCDSCGYDTDSRAAERTYKAVVTATRKLEAFLQDSYDDLMNIERL